MREIKHAVSAALQALVFCMAAVACGGAMRFWDDVNEPKDDVILEDCREVGRKARDAGASEYRAFDLYRECREEAGVL